MKASDTEIWVAAQDEKAAKWARLRDAAGAAACARAIARDKAVASQDAAVNRASAADWDASAAAARSSSRADFDADEAEAAAFAEWMAASAAERALALAEQPARVQEMTPEMMRKVQMHSELGAYAAANLLGAYDLFAEFWRVAMSVAPQAQPAPVDPDSSRIDWLTNNPLDALDIFGHVKGADAVRWIRQEIDNAIEAAHNIKENT